MMGSRKIEDCRETEKLMRGEFKIHLLESRLPDYEELCRDIESVHGGERSVAIHCVTLTELVFALSALERVGVRSGDRIEHASVCFIRGEDNVPADALSRNICAVSASLIDYAAILIQFKRKVYYSLLGVILEFRS